MVSPVFTLAPSITPGPPWNGLGSARVGIEIGLLSVVAVVLSAKASSAGMGLGEAAASLTISVLAACLMAVQTPGGWPWPTASSTDYCVHSMRSRGNFGDNNASITSQVG